MSAATVQVQGGTGGSVSWANAEGGIVWNRADSLTSATATPIPTVPGTNFSWLKNLALAVTVTGTTSITNRRIALASVPPTGMQLFWKDVAQASYAQAAVGNKPTDSGSNGATPSGYTLMSTTPAQWDNTSHVTSASGPNGDMVVCVEGVDATYAGGAGSAQATPSLSLLYDEA